MAVDMIYQQGAAPNTRVAISQKNRIYGVKASGAAPSQIGVLSTFGYDESRALDPVRGVGYGDRIAELVPGATNPMSIKLNRTMLYTAGIVQEIGYKGGVDGLVRSLRHHKWPFDLQSELVFSELAAANLLGKDKIPGATGYSNTQAIVTRFIACWLENYSVDFSSDNAIVMEDASGQATDVTDGTNFGDAYYTTDTGNGIGSSGLSNAYSK